MRFLIASLILCCSAVGYSQQSADPETEVTIADDPSDQTPSKKDKPQEGGGCGCGGKPKMM